jgi:hypothetical protein
MTPTPAFPDEPKPICQRGDFIETKKFQPTDFFGQKMRFRGTRENHPHPLIWSALFDQMPRS